MNKFYRSLGILATITLFMSVCLFQAVQAGQEESSAPKVPLYQTVLGHSLEENVLTNFIVSNHCSSVAQFQLCKDVGIALLIDSNQTVETVYLYLNNADGVAPYQGELPFGLKFYDTMGAVEYKLGRKGVGNAGLPDSGNTSDRLHYRANYEQVGMTIIYNSPSPEDEDATIYAILMSK